MAFRDTWHRALVYFGLAEDEAYEEEPEPYTGSEVEIQDTYRERPNVRRARDASVSSVVKPAFEVKYTWLSFSTFGEARAGGQQLILHGSLHERANQLQVLGSLSFVHGLSPQISL